MGGPWHPYAPSPPAAFHLLPHLSAPAPPPCPASRSAGCRPAPTPPGSAWRAGRPAAAARAPRPAPRRSGPDGTASRTAAEAEQDVVTLAARCRAQWRDSGAGLEAHSRPRANHLQRCAEHRGLSVTSHVAAPPAAYPHWLQVRQLRHHQPHTRAAGGRVGRQQVRQPPGAAHARGARKRVTIGFSRVKGAQVWTGRRARDLE